MTARRVLAVVLYGALGVVSALVMNVLTMHFGSMRPTAGGDRGILVLLSVVALAAAAVSLAVFVRHFGVAFGSLVLLIGLLGWWMFSGSRSFSSDIGFVDAMVHGGMFPSNVLFGICIIGVGMASRLTRTADSAKPDSDSPRVRQRESAAGGHDETPAT